MFIEDWSKRFTDIFICIFFRIFLFHSNYLQSLFPNVQFALNQHWLHNGVVPKPITIVWTYDDPVNLYRNTSMALHDDVIIWKHFQRHWPYVRGIQWSLVYSPHKGQWRGALRFSLICAWTKGWINNRDTSDFRYHHAHYGVSVMSVSEIVELY